jgi:hypothetical protein
LAVFGIFAVRSSILSSTLRKSKYGAFFEVAQKERVRCRPAHSNPHRVAVAGIPFCGLSVFPILRSS